MKKIFNFMLAATMCAATITTTSCKGNDPVVPSQQEIETKIIGKWKSYIVNGEICLTNLRSINTYTNTGIKYVSHSKFSESKGGWMWSNNAPYEYSLEGNILQENSTTSKVKFSTEVQEISENAFAFTRTNLTPDYKGNRISTGIMTRIASDFSQDIIGMWEGVEMTGYETYGNAEARIEYRADGTYTYYKKEGDNWVPSADADNEYNVDGDWLATRWRPEAGADYNYEWWDIDYIKDGAMKWSALREKEDGTRFTTTFTWKKVVK